eukprot:911083-Prorocentrum_minimum.AAC.1
MAVPSPLCIDYDVSLVPSGGSEVFLPCLAPFKSEKKEPAGHLFHKAALLAAGVTSLGEDALGSIFCALCTLTLADVVADPEDEAGSWSEPPTPTKV